MKPKAIIGILLIFIGVVAFAYQGFTYTTRETAIDLGPLQITAEKSHTIPLPPVVGTVLLAGGILLLVLSRKQA
jgi:uncharacterized membrane protein